jgi:hypothetical protein
MNNKSKILNLKRLFIENRQMFGYKNSEEIDDNLK